MKIKLLITAVASFVLGALAACGLWWHAQTQWLVHPKEVELASRAAIDAEVLAQSKSRGEERTRKEHPKKI